MFSLEPQRGTGAGRQEVDAAAAVATAFGKGPVTNFQTGSSRRPPGNLPDDLSAAYLHHYVSVSASSGSIFG